MSETRPQDTAAREANWPAWPPLVCLGIVVPYWILGHHKYISSEMYLPTLVVAALWVCVTLVGRLFDRKFRAILPLRTAPWLWTTFAPLAGAVLKLVATRMPDGSRSEFLLYPVATWSVWAAVLCFFTYSLIRYGKLLRHSPDSLGAYRTMDALAGAFLLGIIANP